MKPIVECNTHMIAITLIYAHMQFNIIVIYILSYIFYPSFDIPNYNFGDAYNSHGAPLYFCLITNHPHMMVIYHLVIGLMSYRVVGLIRLLLMHSSSLL